MTQDTNTTSGAADLRAEVAMIDAAMVEMTNITPPLKRSECARLLRAALAAGQATAAQQGAAYAALPESLILAVDRWFSANTGLGGCSDKDVRELAELFYGVTHAGGRESVDDALAIVESFGPGIDGINDTYARQILLADEVKRLRASHGQAPAQAAPLKTEHWNPLEGGNAETALQMACVIAHRDAQAAPAAVAVPVVNRATVIDWLDANDIEVTDRQMDGLFHSAAQEDKSHE